MKCINCKFYINGKCTYPEKIYTEEYIFEDGKIVGCRRGRL